MSNEKTKAIDNSLGWYRSVFQANGIPLEISKEAFFSRVQAPPLFSNLATRDSSWLPDEIFYSIDSAFTRGHWGEWTIKDSFGNLQLGEFGFSKLFDAQWFYLSALHPCSQVEGVTFKSVRSQEDLRGWIVDWGEIREDRCRGLRGSRYDGKNSRSRH